MRDFVFRWNGIGWFCLLVVTMSVVCSCSVFKELAQPYTASYEVVGTPVHNEHESGTPEVQWLESGELLVKRSPSDDGDFTIRLNRETDTQSAGGVYPIEWKPEFDEGQFDIGAPTFKDDYVEYTVLIGPKFAGGSDRLKDQKDTFSFRGTYRLTDGREVSVPVNIPIHLTPEPKE